MKSINIVTRISLALGACSVAAVAFCFQVGLFPDWRAERIAHRSRLCESLAASLSLGPIQQGGEVAHQHLLMFQRRNPNAITLGLRHENGPLISQVGIHDKRWSELLNNQSDGCFAVPIVKNKAKWGQLEITFQPLYRWGWQAYLPVWLGMASIIGCLVFMISHLFLGRILRHLDPSQIVPTRVKQTLDSFAEGVLLLDPSERVVLANQAFSDSAGIAPEALVGKIASELPWHNEDDDCSLPWQKVATNKKAIRGASLKIKSEIGSQHFSVNSVPVLDDKGSFQGVMVAFADVTALEEKKERLAVAMDELRLSHNDIAEKNEELAFLATRDPLTGCLNRRSLFERFEAAWQQAMRAQSNVSCIMVDIDFFKSINDNHGHAMGDEVLRQVGKSLTDMAREYDLPSRYGGEEFCVVLPGENISDAFEVAERIRLTIADMKFENFTISASLGVSSTEMRPLDCNDLINQADKSLYQAKQQGRNQTICFDQITAKSNDAGLITTR